MKRLLPIALVTVIAACGGDGLPVAGTPASSPGTASPAAVKIDGANYLDAFAIGAVALSRVIDAGHIVGIVSDGTSRLDPPGAQDCWAIGAFEWHDWIYSAYTVVNRPCLSGSVELRSGTFESVGGATREDDFGLAVTISNVVWRHPPNLAERKIVGNMGLKPNADGSTTIAGWFSVLRTDLGIDEYMLVSVVALPATVGQAARATAGSLRVRSDPFALHWLTVVVSDAGAKVSVTAPDGSHVDVSDAADGTTSARKFEVFDADGSVPIVTQTLSIDDPLVAAALARAQG